MKDLNLDGFGEVGGILEADEPVALCLVTPLVSHHWSEFSRSHNQLGFSPIFLDPNLQTFRIQILIFGPITIFFNNF